jgi:hypothetical protein
MLHLIKLAVGVRDIAHLQEIQDRRAKTDPPLRHQTRNQPRRADEITAGGSLYWVIQGAVTVRQLVRDIVADTWDDGSACAGIVLDPVLVPVLIRPVKAFQGWRYLPPADAPIDLAAARGSDAARGVAALPPPLMKELRALCLL